MSQWLFQGTNERPLRFWQDQETFETCMMNLMFDVDNIKSDVSDNKWRSRVAFWISLTTLALVILS